jgi:hypothetical protein
MLFAFAFRQLVDRGFVAFYTILVCGNLKSLAVVVFNPNAVLTNPAVLDFADAMRHGPKLQQVSRPGYSGQDARNSNGETTESSIQWQT